MITQLLVQRVRIIHKLDYVHYADPTTWKDISNH